MSRRSLPTDRAKRIDFAIKILSKTNKGKISFQIMFLHEDGDAYFRKYLTTYETYVLVNDVVKNSPERPTKEEVEQMMLLGDL